MLRTELVVVAVLAGATWGCVADISGTQSVAASAGATGRPGSPNTDLPQEPSEWRPGVVGNAQSAGPMPLRQLNRIEYRNALTELFGDSLEVEKLLPGDVSGTSGFATAGLASEVTVQALQQAAERLAATADVSALSGCDAAGAGGAGCLDTLLNGIGQRAFRRPLTPQERAEYTDLHASLQSDGQGFAGATRGVIEALLQSPAFLYHWELGSRAPTRDADGAIKLGGYELASRLSFLLWSSLPDAELLQAANSGGLEQVAGVEAQARRLLASAKAGATMHNFNLQWLDVSLAGLTRSAERYPTFNPAAAVLMEDELVSAAQGIYRAGSVQDLFFSTPNDGQRFGLLTTPAFLTATSNAYEGDPTKRGVVIRKRVLCGTLVPAPANIPDLPAVAPNQSVRDRHEMHMSVEPCKSCHQLTDPIGFGLGNYDAIGNFQSQDGGKPVDARGFVSGIDGGDVPFSDAAGLMSLLSESEDVRACLTKQWLRFGFAREESRADDASLETTYQAFARSGFQLSELLVAFASSRSFRYRAPAPGEVAQ